MIVTNYGELWIKVENFEYSSGIFFGEGQILIVGHSPYIYVQFSGVECFALYR